MRRILKAGILALLRTDRPCHLGAAFVLSPAFRTNPPAFQDKIATVLNQPDLVRMFWRKSHARGTAVIGHPIDLEALHAVLLEVISAHRGRFPRQEFVIQTALEGGTSILTRIPSVRAGSCEDQREGLLPGQV